MDEDDNDELLQISDEESMTESEETCQSLDKPADGGDDLAFAHFPYASHTIWEFLLIKLLVVISATVLLILLPIYQESMQFYSNAYTIVFFNSTASVVLILLILLVNLRYCPCIQNIKYSKSPLQYSELILSSTLFTASGLILTYALDEKRVLCHLQDPMKGLVLVFSLIYYFFFCRKLMGLQRIFSSTTVIVGLFISVDYALCNEFRCRGHDRDTKADDAGTWSWQTHSIWSGVYILGLALFSAFYMLLDRYIVTTNTLNYTSLSAQFLSTISRLVSFQHTNSTASQPLTPSATPLRNRLLPKKEYSSVHLALWMHFVVTPLSICMFWLEFIPGIGTSSNFTQFLNQTTSGIECIVTPPKFGDATVTNCGNTSLYAWLFLFAYVAFVLSTLRFLILCQSAVYCVATTTLALPLSGVWWSLFQTVSVARGLVVWNPTLSGELICALLGMPIVAIGLGLLAKSHFADAATTPSVAADGHRGAMCARHYA